MYHCADVDDVITARLHLLLPHTMAPLPSCCSAQPATAVVTPPPLSSNSNSSNMLDSVALDEAISNFRDVATSLDMTSGHGELLTEAQLNDNTSASFSCCGCPLSSVCLLYRTHHYHIAQVWMWVGVVIYDM